VRATPTTWKTGNTRTREAKEVLQDHKRIHFGSSANFVFNCGDVGFVSLAIASFLRSRVPRVPVVEEGSLKGDQWTTGARGHGE
jgi:hypothetical protein